MTNRKFYKTVVRVVILSEEPIGQCSLGDIDYQISQGDWSGHVNTVSKTKLNGKQVVLALAKQASSPEFFQLDEMGNDIEETISESRN